MKYLKQLLLILLFSIAGEALQALIPLPVPAAIYGLVLMLVALCSGAMKAEAIADTAHFLIGIMPLLFVAPAVNILQNWGVIAPNLVPICVIMVASTFVVFIVSGVVTQLLLKKKGGEQNA